MKTPGPANQVSSSTGAALSCSFSLSTQTSWQTTQNEPQMGKNPTVHLRERLSAGHTREFNVLKVRQLGWPFRGPQSLAVLNLPFFTVRRWAVYDLAFMHPRVLAPGHLFYKWLGTASSRGPESVPVRGTVAGRITMTEHLYDVCLFQRIFY